MKKSWGRDSNPRGIRSAGGHISHSVTPARGFRFKKKGAITFVVYKITLNNLGYFYIKEEKLIYLTIILIKKRY